jgi:hypothetical protein
MKKLGLDLPFFYLASCAAIVVGMAARTFEPPSPEFLWPWILGAVLAMLGPFLAISIKRKITLVLFLVAILSMPLLRDPRSSFLVVVLETLLLLSWDEKFEFSRNWRFYFTAGLALGIFVGLQLAELLPFIISFDCSHARLRDSKRRSQPTNDRSFAADFYTRDAFYDFVHNKISIA